ncbi:MAG: hypothetical protein FWG30_08510 [Eubacteriaceae bacterium]|nr:hypothetical protein [Eubacteriaceae bacterium]
MTFIDFEQAFSETVASVMRNDGSVVYIGDRMTDLAEEFGQRIISLPYGENLAASAALGLAMTGAKPILRIPGELLLRYADAIGNEIALADTAYDSQYDSSVIIIADIGYKEFSGPHLSQSFEAVFCQFPGLAVVYPSNPEDEASLIRSAASYNGPVLILENSGFEAAYNSLPGPAAMVGRSKLVREGTDITIASYGPIVNSCISAADLAYATGIECEIIDLISLNPLDSRPVIESLKKTGKLIIVHESRKACGVGAELSAQIAESDALFYLDSKILRVCSKDQPIPYSKADFSKATPNEEDILKAIIQLSTGE